MGWRVKPSHHSVMFLCNDDHGMPTGRVEAVEISDEIRLVWPTERPPTLRVRERRFNVGRYHYAHFGHTTWVGNIFWDSVTMHVSEARMLIRNLLAAGWVVEEHAESGPFAHLIRGAIEKAEPAEGADR